MWGLPGLDPKMLKKVELSNALLVAAILIAEVIATAGGSASIGHLADPGKPPFPSIFALPTLIEMEQRINAQRWTFAQCMCTGVPSSEADYHHRRPRPGNHERVRGTEVRAQEA